MSEHTHREKGNDEKRDEKRKGRGNKGFFLKERARATVLKWEHEDRCLHPSSSLNIPATQQGGGWSRNGPEGITVTSQRHLLARCLARPLGRSSAVEQPHFPRVPRGAHAPRGTPRTSGGFARRTSLGKGPKRRCAALQRAVCCKGTEVGGRTSQPVLGPDLGDGGSGAKL
jgi:hypothetical protein